MVSQSRRPKGAQAEYALALCYADGDGVPQDLVEAYKWLTLAATHGHTQAAEFKPILAKKLTPISRSKVSSSRTPRWAASQNRKLNALAGRTQLSLGSPDTCLFRRLSHAYPASVGCRGRAYRAGAHARRVGLTEIGFSEHNPMVRDDWTIGICSRAASNLPRKGRPGPTRSPKLVHQDRPGDGLHPRQEAWTQQWLRAIPGIISSAPSIMCRFLGLG